MSDSAHVANGMEALHFRDWHADNGVSPEYRAFYSNQPSILHNSHEPAPSAEDSIFVRRPDITEALEAVQACKPGQESHTSSELAPLDPELALQGLRKIKKSLKNGDGDELSTSLSMPSGVEIKDASGYAQLQADEQRAPQPQESARPSSADQAEVTQKPAGPRPELVGIVEGIKKADTLQPFNEAAEESYLELSTNLSLDGNGSATVMNNRKYQIGLSEIATKSLEDPDFCFDFYRTGQVILMYSKVYGQQFPGSESLSNKLLKDFTAELQKTVLDIDTINLTSGAWMRMVQGLPSSQDYFPEDDLDQATIPSEGGKTNLTPQQARNIFIMEITAAWSTALKASLELHAKSAPHEAFDALYEVARLGFNPEHAAKFRHTFDIVRRTMTDSPEIRAVASFGLTDTSDRERMLKCLDLQEVLEASGHPPIDHFIADFQGGLRERRYSGFVRKIITDYGSVSIDEAEKVEGEIEGIKEEAISSGAMPIAHRLQGKRNPMKHPKISKRIKGILDPAESPFNTTGGIQRPAHMTVIMPDRR